MATRAKFGDGSHIFLKNGLWRMSASPASPRKGLGECWPFWRVLQNGLENVSESGESSQHGSANVGEYSPNLLAKVGARALDKKGNFYV
jgi:hypothetical protein